MHETHFTRINYVENRSLAFPTAHSDPKSDFKICLDKRYVATHLLFFALSINRDNCIYDLGVRLCMKIP